MKQSKPLTLAEAANHFPRRNGKKVHVKTLLRRIVNGCRGVHLRAFKDGNTWFTTVAWIREFQETCTARSIRSARRSDEERMEAAADAKGLFDRRYGRGKETEAVLNEAVHS